MHHTEQNIEHVVFNHTKKIFIENKHDKIQNCINYWVK